jgi:uncharacterized protein YaaR (DUF327 family)
MDKVPGGSLPFVNPAAYTTVRPETQKSADLKSRDKGAVKALKKTPFSRLLEAQSGGTAEEVGALPAYPPSEEALQELLDDVHSAGDALKQRPLAEEITQYKRAVRHFLHYVVENSYSLESHEGVPNYLKPGFKGQRGSKEAMSGKLHYSIQVVDQKLEQLASGILSGQLGQLYLLDRLDEITGLLVDLMK